MWKKGYDLRKLMENRTWEFGKCLSSVLHSTLYPSWSGSLSSPGSGWSPWGCYGSCWSLSYMLLLKFTEHVCDCHCCFKLFCSFFLVSCRALGCRFVPLCQYVIRPEIYVTWLLGHVWIAFSLTFVRCMEKFLIPLKFLCQSWCGS